MNLELIDGTFPLSADPPVPRNRETATALALRQVTAISADFDTVEAGLQALEAKFSCVVFQMDTPKGMAEARAARAEIREVRYRVQRAVADAKRPLNALKSAIEGRGEQIIERIEPVEEPIHRQIILREAELEREKAERDRIAAEKAKAVTLAIAAITESLTACANQPMAVLDERIAVLSALDISLDWFGDRAGEAEQVKARTLVALVDMRVARTAFEAQQAEIERREQEYKRRQQEEDARWDEAVKADIARMEQQRKDNEAESQRLARERAAIQALQDAARAERQAVEDAERAERQRKEDAERAGAQSLLVQQHSERAENRRIDDAAMAEQMRHRAELLAETERLAQEAEALKKLHDAAPALLAAALGVQALILRMKAEVSVPWGECQPVYDALDAAIDLATK